MARLIIVPPSSLHQRYDAIVRCHACLEHLSYEIRTSHLMADIFQYRVLLTRGGRPSRVLSG